MFGEEIHDVFNLGLFGWTKQGDDDDVVELPLLMSKGDVVAEPTTWLSFSESHPNRNFDDFARSK